MELIELKIVFQYNATNSWSRPNSELSKVHCGSNIAFILVVWGTSRIHAVTRALLWRHLIQIFVCSELFSLSKTTCQIPVTGFKYVYFHESQFYVLLIYQFYGKIYLHFESLTPFSFICRLLCSYFQLFVCCFLALFSSPSPFRSTQWEQVLFI